MLLFTNENHTATLLSGILASWGQRRFNDASAILDCKSKNKNCNLQILFHKNVVGSPSMKYYDWLVETMKWDKFSTLHTHKK